MKINWKSPVPYIIITAIGIGLYFLFTSQWFKNLFADSAEQSNNTSGTSQETNNTGNVSNERNIGFTSNKYLLVPFDAKCELHTPSNPYRNQNNCYIFDAIVTVNNIKRCRLKKINCP